LRHTFGTLLAASGVYPKTAQELMRHSKIDLTMSIYTHTLQGQNRQAIENLPELDAPKQKAAS
jgi:integrase